MQIQDSNHFFENPFFLATVVDNNDTTQNYRIKVRIDVIHSSIEDENLPWAAKVNSSFMGIGEDQSIMHSIPEVGSTVLVLAIGNDPNSLVYLGSLYKKTSQTPSSDKYLNTYGIYTKNGEFIGVEKIKNIFHMIWNGDLTLDVQGKIKLGSNAMQPAVLGDDLKMQVQMMIATFNTHTHTGNLGIKTSPPETPMEISEFTSEKVTVE